jgi:chromosome partitioning protein
MHVLAVWSVKGGVGKTAAAVNLASLAAAAGLRTLLWDLDPQGATSFYFRVRARVKGGGRTVVRRSVDLRSLVRATDVDNLDLLPADFSYGRLDLELDARKKPARRIARKLAPLAADYDWTMLDCPPSVSLASEAVLCASEALLVPVIPTTLAVRGLAQVREFAVAVAGKHLRIMPFLSMVDRRKKLHREIVERCGAAAEGFLPTAIPTASAVERMGVHRQPVVRFAPRSAAAAAFTALWEDVRERVSSGR